jgi:hypothetical protein
MEVRKTYKEVILSDLAAEDGLHQYLCSKVFSF